MVYIIIRVWKTGENIMDTQDNLVNKKLNMLLKSIPTENQVIVDETGEYTELAKMSGWEIVEIDGKLVYKIIRGE